MHPFWILLAGMFMVVGGMLLLRLHAFLALLLGALLVAFLTSSEALQQFALAKGMAPSAVQALAASSIGERVAEGFGRTCGQVGILIAMASIIGICLLESGAADRLVRTALWLVGEARASLAFLASGFLLAVPVFFDTVFYLMVPIVKALQLRTGRNYVLYILSVVAGGTMAHSLVPPTPGPLFVAGELGVDLGLMILGGSAVGLVAAFSGYGFARWANRRWEIPLRESPEALAQLQNIAHRRDDELPPAWLSILPILLPVLLITAETVQSSIYGAPESLAGRLLAFAGDKNIALILGAGIALALLLRMESGGALGAAVKRALGTAGVIILIIGAGGAFGTTLQQTGIGQSIEELSRAYELSLIPLAFLLTALVRTAQGSATVAMITAAGAFSGVVQAGEMDIHPLYIALAIGCGSKLIWWMNDSGFWVVSQMSGMTERESIKTLTPINCIMGLSGLLVLMIAAQILPNF